ncbi:MAG: LUD domain-containing protein [Bacteroidales bacterium]
MDGRDSRKVILDRLRSARLFSGSHSQPAAQPHRLSPDEFLPAIEEHPTLLFARNLTRAGGKFAFCSDRRELILALRILWHEEQWVSVSCADPFAREVLDAAGITYLPDPEDLESAEAAVTGCESLIARTGSVLVSSAQGAGRRVFGHTPVHVVIAQTSQIELEIHHALDRLKSTRERMPSQVSLITGPSRTADIEKTLVMGAHGPANLFVFLEENGT